MMALKSRAMPIFAPNQALSGIGVARLTCSHPWPRSTATLTPKPNSDAPITPNAPYVAIRYVAIVVEPTDDFVPNATPKKR